MRRQPRARTTKQKARIDSFYDVEEKATSRQIEDKLSLTMQMQRMGSKILELENICKSYNDKTLLKDFSYTFKKGERVGVIGKNGAGKSTFLNILLGTEPADSGKINTGDTVIFGNYSQQGLVIKEDMRVIEFVKSIAENFPLATGGSLSSAQFLQLFLFDPDKQYTYISKLSGGEKRRLHLLSILFRNPNFLILDEPTNDLDLPTLGVLENFLSEFPGCLVIASHDRYFMDRLVDHLFVFEGDGIIRDFPGNYTQYRVEQNDDDSITDEKKKPIITNTQPVAIAARKPSYKEKREFEILEKQIADLAAEKQIITEKLSNGNLPFEELQKFSNRIGEVTQMLDEKEFRWLELSELMQ